MSETRSYYTAMPEKWDDKECQDTVEHFLKEGAPWRDEVVGIITPKNASRVVKITVEVLDQTLGELREDKQHKD